MKNSNGTIGNRTRDLPVCSAVPQPNDSTRSWLKFHTEINIKNAYRHLVHTYCFLCLLLIRRCGWHLKVKYKNKGQ